MQTNDVILFVLTVVIAVLAVVIAVLLWQIRCRHQLLKRRREVVERERREADRILQQRKQDIDDGIPTFRDIESEVEHPQLTLSFDEQYD